MSKLRKALLPILIIVVAIVISRIMIANRPPPARAAAPPAPPLVQVQELTPRGYRVQVKSRGVVEAHTRSDLVAQVGGEIQFMHPNFRDGGYFRAGEVLVRIDQRDFKLAVTMAQAELAAAQQTLQEEQARGAQAQRDWERLGGGGEANDLALRKPQLAGARAALAAAQANLEQARLNLSRAEIRAPYDGRVLSKQVDLGQVVSAGTPLGEIYATDKVEVQLPLSNRQTARLALPDQYLDDADESAGSAVSLIAQIGERAWTWQGRIVRSAGAIDRESRQTFVVAQVDDPYVKREDGGPPLMVGQYVEARIDGEQLEDVFVIPRGAVRGEDLAYVLDDKQQLVERRLDIAWQDDNAMVVRGGLNAGERLVTTVPSLATTGMKVRLEGAQKAQQPERPAKRAETE